MKKTIAILMGIGTLISAGCAYQAKQWAEVKRGASTGKVPCLTEDIEATDEPAKALYGSTGFEVRCYGIVYQCGIECNSYSGYICAEGQTQCTAVGEGVLPPYTPPRAGHQTLRQGAQNMQTGAVSF